jgi:ribosome-binding protein aMBF1 (putative translation factor)
LPPGLLNGLLFFGVVVVGVGYIVISKLNDFSAVAVTAVPVLVMIGYAVLLAARPFRLRDDQSGDNLYYMGFLFTLTSLAVSLYQFSAAGSAEQIVQNFGIAIASTIAGITMRIFFNQMRRDPIEVEASARLELAEASRRVKRELESTILEFGYFRRMTQQSVSDAVDEARESIGSAREKLAAEIEKFVLTQGQPFEDASRRSSETLDSMNERTVQILEVSRQLVQEGEQLAKSTASVVKAIDSLLAELGSLRTPGAAAEDRLAPLIESLTQVVDKLNKSAETQSENIDINLRHTHSVVVAVNQLLREIRTVETTRSAAGSFSVKGRDR